MISYTIVVKGKRGKVLSTVPVVGDKREAEALADRLRHYDCLRKAEVKTASRKGKN